MARRSDSVLYARLTGIALAITLILAAAAFFVACFIATHLTVALGRVAEPGLGRRTHAVRDGILAGLAAAAGWALLVGALVASLAGDVHALPYGLILGIPVAAVVGWQYGHWQTAVSWAHAPGASVLGDHRQGRLFRLRRPYTVTPLERVKHMGVTGATGTGKSTMLRRMIVRDIQSGAGVCVIDPKDDLVDRILGHIPAHRVKDVILFDATDRERPLGINPFAGVSPEQRSLACGEILAVFRRYFQDAWGARLEHVLRNCVLALLEIPGATLLDIPRLLMDRSFSAEVAGRVTNPAVRDFFLVEFEQVLRRRGDAVEPILNKVGPWLAYPELRNIVGQPRSAFDFREVLDHGKVLLVRIPQGALGEDASNLLGALIVAKVQLAAQSRVNLPSERRRRFYLYVDEFQNFATSSFAKILTEARGFGLGLICANQYPEQLSRDLQLAVGRNAATLVQCVLRKGRHELQVVRQEDASEKHPEAFTVQPPPPLDAGDRERAAVVRLQSRERYGARVEPVPPVAPTVAPPPTGEPAGVGTSPNGHQAGGAWGRDLEEE